MPLPVHGRPRESSRRSWRFVRHAVISAAAAGVVLAWTPVAARQAVSRGPSTQPGVDTVPQERIAASFVLARGRVPTDAEVSDWSAAAAAPFS